MQHLMKRNKHGISRKLLHEEEVERRRLVSLDVSLEKGHMEVDAETLEMLKVMKVDVSGISCLRRPM